MYFILEHKFPDKHTFMLHYPIHICAHLKFQHLITQAMSINHKWFYFFLKVNINSVFLILWVTGKYGCLVITNAVKIV